MNKSLLYHTNDALFNSILSFKNIEFTKVGNQRKIKNYNEYNYLIDVNNCFSTEPRGDIIDRTGQIQMPFNYHIDRPLAVKSTVLELDKCFELRITELCNTNNKLNLFWSGGIDSTAMVIGFLKHCSNLSQLRILYSTASMKENPNFYLDLLDNAQLEMVEFSGDVYMEQQLDGLFICGDGADDITASLDLSFYNEVGYNGLYSPWRDFFFKKSNDINFVNFCEQYFSVSQLPITTVLEARWWFYVMCKIQRWAPLLSEILNSDQPMAIAFFDTDEFETYSYFNIDKIIENQNYNSYKQFLKDYIYDYNKDLDYNTQKEKENSNQIAHYKNKLVALKSTRSIMILRDGTRIQTKNLPLLSNIEFTKDYGSSLDYLFNC